MKKKETKQFYDDKGFLEIDLKTLKRWSKLVDDTATSIYIPTPKNWKCKRKGCKMNYKHTHGAYPSLDISSIPKRNK